MNNKYSLTLSSDTKEVNQYYIIFTIKEKQYAINIQNVLEVINIPEVEIPIAAPKSIIGIFNYNGLMIKVIDLCPFLGFKPSNFSINNKLIITFVDGICFAVHTEAIDNIVQLESSLIQDLPFNMKNSILKSVYKSDDNSINILDIQVLNNLISSNNVQNSEMNYAELFPTDEKSRQILKLRAVQNKKSQEIFSFPFNLNSVNQYILFTLDNQNYYIDLKYIKEFISIKRLNITKLPYTPDFIKGIINLKGDFLVVLDLKRFLNNDINSIEEGSKLIIVSGKDYNLALLVDEIKYIKNLKDVQKFKKYEESSPYIFAEFLEDDVLYSILNFEKIINDERLYVNIE